MSAQLQPFEYGNISIEGRPIGQQHPCFLIAEVAQAHDGSLGAAHAYIELAARCGADAVKFQTHIAAAESTREEPFRVKFSRQDATRYDYWKRMEFSAEQWQGLAAHARDLRLVFLSTPFSFEAVDLLERLDMAAWKVASGEITNIPLLRRMAGTGRPLLLSSGVSSWRQLDEAVGTARAAGAEVALFQCTTTYPCPPDRVGLNVLAELRQRYRCPVGLSDHTGTIYASLAAATLGADLVELHLVFSRDCFGPDVPASVTGQQFQQVVQGIRFIEAAQANPLDKDAMAGEMSQLRTMFGKSVVAARQLPAGHQLCAADLALKKPGTGIPAAELEKVVGRRLKHAVATDTLLSENDFDSATTS